MEVLNANVIIKEQMTLGEGPLWNEQSQKLNFVDIENKRIYEYNSKNKELSFISVDDRVGCIVPTKNENIVAGITNKWVLIDRKTKGQQTLKKIDLPDGIRFNDGKCDSAGRFLIGTMAINQNAPYAKECGKLYSYKYGEGIKTLLCNLAIPNGIAFSKDNKILYHIDTESQTIMEYTYNISTGNIGKGHKIIDFPIRYGSPDGMCIDENDNLWVALWGGYKVACVDTKLKKIVSEIKVDAKFVSCCCFGGKNLDELFITTAKDENGNGGQVFHAKLNVKGTLPYKFKMEE